MEFLRDLLEASKKKTKVSRTTASTVYHRDYVKTKRRPYRKYDPSEHAKLTETMTDPLPDYSEHPPVDTESMSASLTKLVDLLAQYDRLQSASQVAGETTAHNPSLQFSSFLHQTGTSLMEDKWNFNERPPQEGPGAPAHVSDVSANISASPVEPSTDVASVKKAAGIQIKQILSAVKQLGPNAAQQLIALCAKHCGDKANRVMSVLTQAAQKMGVQL